MFMKISLDHARKHFAELIRRVSSGDEALVQDRLCVSAISFWEAAMLVRRGRITLPTDIEFWRQDILASGMNEISLEGKVAIRSVQLEDFHADPADRFITATATAFPTPPGRRFAMLALPRSTFLIRIHPASLGERASRNPLLWICLLTRRLSQALLNLLFSDQEKESIIGNPCAMLSISRMVAFSLIFLLMFSGVSAVLCLLSLSGRFFPQYVPIQFQCIGQNCFKIYFSRCTEDFDAGDFSVCCGVDIDALINFNDAVGFLIAQSDVQRINLFVILYFHCFFPFFKG